MKSFVIAAFLCLVLIGSSARSHAEEQIECLKSSAFFAPVDSADYRKYAPDRDVDVLHLALDVTPNFKDRTVAGTAELKFKVNVRPAVEFRLDGVDLTVSSITSTEKIQAWQATEDHVIITFSSPIPAGKTGSVTVAYTAIPQAGLYFRTPELGYPEGDAHLFSQGEEIEARNWYPCFDSPNMKFTSEITCHVPEGMTVISNGRLVSEQKDAAGLTAFHWSQEKPHANYLISLAAGYFKKLEDKHGSIPLAFFTPASQIDAAKNSFSDTRDMMEFFEKEIGVPYPWAKYFQVCVNDFVAGGMENTSCTTLTDTTLHLDATENLRSSEGLVAHELAHQWFGDLATCKDWSHVWLNEGFATYYETLYNGHKNGRDAMLYELYGRTRLITGVSNDVHAIVRRNFDRSGEMFNYLAYDKGSWVLHMLRSDLGEDLYRRSIKTFLERYAFGSVTTDDLRSVIENLSGRSMDQFFDQWLYLAHHPELDVSYAWDETMGMAKLSIRQSQKISEAVPLFSFPLTVRFKGKFGTVDKIVQVREKEEDFYFSLDSAPTVVRLDPDYTLLCKTSFRLPNTMIAAQLADADDMIGRLLAVEQLGERRDKEAVSTLKQTLRNDPFFGVRIEASRKLRAIHTDDALAALLDSASQTDARVRKQVVDDIAAFYRDTAYQSALATLGREKNPDIVASAIESLAGYDKPEVHDKLIEFLNSDSFRNVLAGAAVAAIRSQDDPAFVPELLKTLKVRQAAFTSRGFANALGALAYLARNETKKDDVRQFLLEHVNSPRRTVQRAALAGLGTLGDPQAIAVLQRFALAGRESPERATAERALTELRTGRKPIDDFKNLRSELSELQKSNRDLKKQIETLEKEFKASKPSAEKTSTKPQPKKIPDKKSPVISPKNR